jgi:lipid II:glycine glycyltransferase (peptidoglycan interpeptide bridge formation enzyme)
MNYTIDIDNFTQEDWQLSVRQFRDYTVYQSWAYQQVRCEKEHQQISRAIVRDKNDRAVAMLQVRIKPIPLTHLRVGYVQWGPLIDRRDCDNFTDFSVFSLIRQAYLKKVDVLRLVPSIVADERGKHIASVLEQSGYRRVVKCSAYHTFYLPIDDDESMQNRLDRSWRRSLKKAERAGIEIKESSAVEDFYALEEIYNTSKHRKGFSGLNPKIFIQTQQHLSSDEKMQVIIAYCQGIPVTAHASSYLGQMGEGILAGSTKEGLSCGASYLVWWKTLLAAKRAGMKIYNLGGIDPQKNPSVYQFKMRMGGQEIFHIGTFDAVRSSTAHVIWKGIDTLHRAVCLLSP